MRWLLVNPHYEFFYVTLYGVQFFKYTSFGETATSEPSVFLALADISAKELEILSTKVIASERIEVFCQEDLFNPHSSQCGTLSFKADYALLHDQGGNPFSLPQLIELVNRYMASRSLRK